MSDTTSLLERIRAQRQAGLQKKRLELEVPGYSGMLALRYKPIPWEDTVRLLEDAVTEASAKAAVKSNTATLIEACDAFLVREEGTCITLADALREQGENVHGEVRFDAYAVDALTLTVQVDVNDEVTFDEEKAVGERAPQGAHETVLAVFACAVSPELAIAEQAARLAAWMRSAGSEVDEALAGG